MSVLLAHITPGVLQWARDKSGYTVDALKAELKLTKVTTETIHAWEKGEQLPTYSQLEKLAEIYHRPIALFYFPYPPKEEKIQEKLRSLPADYAKSLSPKMHYLVRKAQVKQMNLSDIYGSIKPNDFRNFINRVGNVSDVSELAKRVREIIKVPLEEQFGWKDHEFGFKEWRSKLGDLGIWIFKDSFKEKDYAGFCLYDEFFPVVYVSTNAGKNPIPTQRQIFTLFHELAHLIVGNGGVDFRKNVRFTGKYEKEEVFCNAFAGEFLVPSNSIEVASAPNDDEIDNYANQYKVSREVILRKYLDRNLINQYIYNQKVQQWKVQWEEKQRKESADKAREREMFPERLKEQGGPSYYIIQKSYLGDKYLRLAFQQHYQQRISESQLADYLGIKVKHLASIEGYMLKVDY